MKKLTPKQALLRRKQIGKKFKKVQREEEKFRKQCPHDKTRSVLGGDGMITSCKVCGVIIE